MGEAVDEAKASMGLTLEGVRARSRGSESLSRNDCGDWWAASEVVDMDAWASALEERNGAEGDASEGKKGRNIR